MIGAATARYVSRVQHCKNKRIPTLFSVSVFESDLRETYGRRDYQRYFNTGQLRAWLQKSSEEISSCKLWFQLDAALAGPLQCYQIPVLQFVKRNGYIQVAKLIVPMMQDVSNLIQNAWTQCRSTSLLQGYSTN